MYEKLASRLYESLLYLMLWCHYSVKHVLLTKKRELQNVH